MNKPSSCKPLDDNVATPTPGPLRTTLYDLIAAMQDVSQSQEDLLAVTAAATHVLNTHRVTCEGRFKGMRFVGEDRPTRGRERRLTSQFDKALVSC